MVAYKHIKEVAPAVDGTSETPSRSPVYRWSLTAQDYVVEGPQTLYEAFEASATEFAERPCIGYRPIDSTSGEAGDFTFYTYAETRDKVAAFASALRAAGVTKGQRVAVFGANCCEWMIAMQACNRMSLPCVPLYDTLGENAIEYIIDHSEASLLVTSAAKLPDFAAALPKIERELLGVVYWGAGGGSGSGDAALRGALDAIVAKGMRATPFDEFLVDGAKAPSPADPPAPDDLCTIMYTSGTTGDPKGVLLTHRAMRASTTGLQVFMRNCGVPLNCEDVLLSYLPLAHIFDRTAEEAFLAVGARIGYWQAKLPALVADIGALRPTIFIGVPRVYDRIYNGIQEKIKAAGCIKGMLIKWAYSGKRARLRAGFSSTNAAPLWDKIVFSKFKAGLGGNVRVILSGGAPLAPHVEEFLKVAMCAPVVQGYGLTETCAASFVALPDDADMAGTVGPPQPTTEFCLESVGEMNYDARGTPARGELLVRGPNAFSGYYKMPDKTAEVLESDGWFHTGDVAEVQPSGALKIIDRKKNIFKLSQGEYIAVEKLEGEFKKCPIVNQIWVYGNSFESSLVAVVVPKQPDLEAWAAHHHAKAASFAELCASSEATGHVLTALREQAKASKLRGFEFVKAVHLEPVEFSVDNDLMTPTFKFKRPQLLARYKGEVDRMYAVLKAGSA